MSIPGALPRTPDQAGTPRGQPGLVWTVVEVRTAEGKQSRVARWRPGVAPEPVVSRLGTASPLLRPYRIDDPGG